MSELGWVHHYEPSPGGEAGPLTLLLLHGTGGNEKSLLRLGRQVAPAANLLSVRGRSLEEGYPRFFRRFTATSYDQEQLVSEADALAEFVHDAARRYGFPAAGVVAVGYSNGANIAVAVLARAPERVRAAALLRPVMPFDDPPKNDLSGVETLVLHGATDPYARAAGALTPYLRRQGAQVEEHAVDSGHELAQQDFDLLTTWLSGRIADPATT